MNNLTTFGYFLDEYITEKGSECVRYRIPSHVHIKIDKDKLFREFKEIKGIDIGMSSNGDQEVTIWLYQYQPSRDGKTMRYR